MFHPGYACYRNPNEDMPGNWNTHRADYSDLRYVKRRYLNEPNVKAAIVKVVNKILEIRDPKIWGEATTGCACDSTQVSSWDQNLMSEWHPRYKDRGVMIYWHVDQNSTVIHSQIKTCLSSEIGAMINGVLKLVMHKKNTKVSLENFQFSKWPQNVRTVTLGQLASWDQTMEKIYSFLLKV
jgi:hypothetical protein